MQSLYAVKQSEASNFHHAHEYIKETFAPDLNSMEVQDRVMLEGKRKLASLVFDQNFLAGEITFEEETPEIRKVVEHAIKTYKQSISKEKIFFRNQMVDTTEKLYEIYIFILTFPLDFEHHILEIEDPKIITKVFGVPNPSVFPGNPVVQLLKDNKTINDWRMRKSMRWSSDLLKRILQDAVTQDEDFRQLLNKKDKTFEEQKELILHAFKKFVFKNEFVQEHFEESENNWAENKSIVKSMVLKTVKGVEENTNDLALMELSSNWEEDKEFFIDLYNKTIDNDRYLEDVISKKTKHWDIERVAAIDKIILKMALTEMIHFPSIPVKVSINEYIELSKVYSTPKSKQFINGILDKISADLLQEGVVKKSGRGLIDNK